MTAIGCFLSRCERTTFFLPANCSSWWWRVFWLMPLQLKVVSLAALYYLEADAAEIIITPIPVRCRVNYDRFVSVKPFFSLFALKEAHLLPRLRERRETQRIRKPKTWNGREKQWKERDNSHLHYNRLNDFFGAIHKEDILGFEEVLGSSRGRAAGEEKK